MPLKLSLKPGETFVVNGAVVRNGDRRGVLLLENQARVLREKDILHPADATTPVRHAGGIDRHEECDKSGGKKGDQFWAHARGP